MKRKITFSIVLVLTLTFLSMRDFDSKARAQNQLRTAADTGVIRLGPNQVLRLAITGEGKILGELFTARFRRVGYIEADNIYKVASHTATDPVRLGPGEAATIDVAQGEFQAVRGVVLSNNPDMRVTATIINTVTGEVTARIIMANTEGD